MTSSYWQKVAVERVYVRCCERYAVARASDGKLVQLSRFALDFRALVERGASGARDVSRAALARACVAFLGDDPVAEDVAELLGEQYPLAGVSLAFVDAPMMLYSLDALAGAGARAHGAECACHKVDAHRVLHEWLCDGRSVDATTMPARQLALTPGALTSNALVWDAWLAAQLSAAAAREREYAGAPARREGARRAPASGRPEPRGLLVTFAREAASATLEHRATGAGAQADARTMHAGLIEQRAAAAPGLGATGASEWLDRQIALAVRREEEQRRTFDLAESERLSGAGFVRIDENGGSTTLVAPPRAPRWRALTAEHPLGFALGRVGSPG